MLMLLLSIVLSIIIIILLILSLKQLPIEKYMSNIGVNMTFKALTDNDDRVMVDDFGNFYGLYVVGTDGSLDDFKKQRMSKAMSFKDADWKSAQSIILTSQETEKNRCASSIGCNNVECSKYSLIAFIGPTNVVWKIVPLSDNIPDIYKNLFRLSNSQSIYMC